MPIIAQDSWADVSGAEQLQTVYLQNCNNGTEATVPSFILSGAQQDAFGVVGVVRGRVCAVIALATHTVNAPVVGALVGVIREMAYQREEKTVVVGSALNLTPYGGTRVAPGQYEFTTNVGKHLANIRDALIVSDIPEVTRLAQALYVCRNKTARAILPGRVHCFNDYMEADGDLRRKIYFKVPLDTWADWVSVVDTFAANVAPLAKVRCLESFYRGTNKITIHLDAHDGSAPVRNADECVSDADYFHFVLSVSYEVDAAVDAAVSEFLGAILPRALMARDKSDTKNMSVSFAGGNHSYATWNLKERSSMWVYDTQYDLKCILPQDEVLLDDEWDVQPRGQLSVFFQKLYGGEGTCNYMRVSKPVSAVMKRSLTGGFLWG